MFSNYCKKLNTYTYDEINKIIELESLPYEERLVEICKIIIGNDRIGNTLSIEKKYQSYPLNDFYSMSRGLEVFRILYSNEAARIRKADKKYLHEGMLVYQNIFDDNTHKKIQSEIVNFPLRVNSSNQNLIFTRKNTNIFKAFSSNEFVKIIFDAIGLNAIDQYINNTFVQRLNKKSEAHVIEKNGEDAQYRYHADIFAPSLKWWYFPEEVKEENGPLCYARNTCSLDEKLLDWWYKETCKITNKEHIPEWKEPGHSQGSLRIENEMLEELGYKMEKIVCEPNTLVIANVHGFHARGKPNNWNTNIRNAIHSSIRVKPFETKR